MNHGDAGGIQEVEGEIAVAGNIHAVAGDAVEAQVLGDSLAVDAVIMEFA